jgi:hypothetical protein
MWVKTRRLVLSDNITKLVALAQREEYCSLDKTSQASDSDKIGQDLPLLLGEALINVEMLRPEILLLPQSGKPSTTAASSAC